MATRFNYHQPPTSPHNVEVAAARPQVFVCPAVDELESTLPGVGVTHYVLVVDDDAHRLYDWRTRQWKFQDAPQGTRTPWTFSPEVPWADHGYQRWHESAYDIFGF